MFRRKFVIKNFYNRPIWSRCCQTNIKPFAMFVFIFCLFHTHSDPLWSHLNHFWPCHSSRFCCPASYPSFVSLPLRPILNQNNICLLHDHIKVIYTKVEQVGVHYSCSHAFIQWHHAGLAGFFIHLCHRAALAALSKPHRAFKRE